MSHQPDPTTAVDEWWSKLDLKAPLETDYILSAYRESLPRRRDDEYILGPQERKTQEGYFLSRLDEHLRAMRELDCNRSVPYAGRFLAEIHFYAGADDQMERRGLVELRTGKGQNLLIIGDRLRAAGLGSAAVELAFNGNDEVPEALIRLSPAAFSNELGKIARLLKTPVGQEFLDGLSALYCIVREKISVRHGPTVGWDARLVSFTPHFSGEETSFTLAFEGGHMVSAHLDYVPDMCELEIRTHRMR